MELERSSRWFDSLGWFLLCVLLAIACCSETAFAASKVVTDADKGREIHLRIGDTMELRLPSNPSTGYMWYVQAKSTTLLKMTHQSQTEPTKPGVGRSVFQVFKFEPKRPGQGVLLMHYVRSWEPPTPDDEQFDLRVTVE
jgi:inhibitor of cysteine peptidase